MGDKPSPLVCILTAGKGSRMGGPGKYLNKSLLPVGTSAVISLIIDKFPIGTEFVIGLGYLANQVRDYLTMAHPKVQFHYVDVDKWEGKGTGPGYSLLQCKDVLQRPFYFVACDTLWENDSILTHASKDWVGVATMPKHLTSAYCNFKIENEYVSEIVEKKEIETEINFKSFVGLCFVQSYAQFWAGLASARDIGGEIQISSGIRAIMEVSDVQTIDIDWTDLGTEEKYKTFVSTQCEFDFSKTEEAIYFQDNKVIKYFRDKNVVKNRIAKAKLNATAYPSIEASADNFYCYRFVEGKTMYEDISEEIFSRFLEWASIYLWYDVDDESEKVAQACKSFYLSKTRKRWQQYKDKYPDYKQEGVINGGQTLTIEELLEQVPWQLLAERSIPSEVHGDLQFDNILYSRNNSNFTLLDWRQDFGDIIEFGDRYYDVAKMLGGIKLNYKLVKEGKFSIKKSKEQVHIKSPSWEYSQNCIDILESWCVENNIDWRHVNILVGLIYLNMAPLHEPPFDEFLVNLSRVHLHNVMCL